MISTISNGTMLKQLGIGMDLALNAHWAMQLE